MSKEEELRQRSSIHLSQKHQKHHKHHMAMPWHDFIPEDDHDLARTPYPCKNKHFHQDG